MPAKGKNEITPVEEEVRGNLPAYLQGMQGGTRLSSMGSGDLITPRIILLQGTSPQLEQYGAAKPGIFWHNVLNEPLGNEFEFVVCKDRRRFILWAPRDDDRGILARADDGVHWNPPEGEFIVRPKNSAAPVTWRLAPTVPASGLDKFGSSVPGDPKSPPAATLVYEYLVYMTEYPEMSPALISLTRASIKKGKHLNSKLAMINAPITAQKYLAVSVKDRNATNDSFNNWDFRSSGFADEETYSVCENISQRYVDYRGAEEEQLAAEHSPLQQSFADNVPF